MSDFNSYVSTSACAPKPRLPTKQYFATERADAHVNRFTPQSLAMLRALRFTERGRRGGARLALHAGDGASNWLRKSEANMGYLALGVGVGDILP